MRKFFPALLAGVLVGVAALPAHASKPVKVFQDPVGDPALGGAEIPVLDATGFDLVSGTIARVKNHLEFTVTHAAMPPIGTLPETFRFLWAFTVGKTEYRLTVKSADIGKPDVEAMNGNERIGRVDLMGHFRLEGDCTAEPFAVVFIGINCQPLAYLEGSFDPPSASFTVLVPLKSIKAKTGSKIAGSGGVGSEICEATACWITHLAERSTVGTVIDSAVQTVTYRVPKK